MKKGIQIGWASQDITPDRPANLLGQFHMRISKGVQDPVTITALSVSSGKEAFIWVSCDLCIIPAKVLAQCRAQLKKQIPDFPSEKLIMNATHTHTAPDPAGFWYPPVPAGVMTPAEYGDFLAQRVVAAAVKSWKTRKPGAIAWGLGYAVVAHNRRTVYFDDLSQRPDFVDVPGCKTEKFARMYGNTNDPLFSNVEGCVDHSVNILYTFDSRKKLTGAVINQFCPSQETEGMDYISADFWHDVRVELRKRHGKGLFVLPQCAPAGDLSPHLTYNQKAEQRMLKLKKRTSRQEIAVRLADAFDMTLPYAKQDIRKDALLKHTVQTIKLSRRMISKEEYQKALAGIATFDKSPSTDADGRPYWEKDSVRFSRRYRCQRIVERYEEQKATRSLPMELHVIRLGDIAMATNSFELFLDYGLRMIARSPAEQTFLVQLAAAETSGYLATQKAEAGESYSACLYCNEVSSTGGQELVEETLMAMKALWA